MIEIVEGYIYLTSWDKYLSTEELEKIREQNRRRQAKYREKLKCGKSNVISNDSVTQGNAPDIDSDSDADTDIEIDNSINLSSKEAPKIPIVSSNYTAKQTYRNGKLGKGVVMLSDEQIDDLLNKLSLDEYDHYVGAVADCILHEKNMRRPTIRPSWRWPPRIGPLS